ncbi:conserved hypothetical protein [Ricinus communis]|uniref:Uncharacterized protein n=1 Tax=Ricinus communis TaxID=3988 RepID=B9RG37_RICCO|nr:conserved hypothetical protein [Ricinus communis]
MEDHRHRALLRFLKRSNKPLQLFVDSLTEVVQHLKDSYDLLDACWQQDTSRFLQLMILDGCFLLEMLRNAVRLWMTMLPTIQFLAITGSSIYSALYHMSATELNEAGIRFKKSKTRSLKDISFCGGVLRLLVTMVDDATESTFLNLMALERFHAGAGNEVTSFIFFMDNIIDSERDVAPLHSRGIISEVIKLLPNSLTPSLKILRST